MSHLLIIDEIGLAEIAPENPLKVLHNYLGLYEFNMLGISNNKLDMSKQNRTVCVSRPEMHLDDMVRTVDIAIENSV